MLNEHDKRLFALAAYVGGWSKDRSRKVGAVIADRNGSVRSIGYNGFPRGADEGVVARHERPAKYLWTEHAERNAIFDAARAGVALDGCSMYVPWFPCMDCARAIVQSGISRLVACPPDLKDVRWGGHFEAAMELLEETGVEVVWVPAMLSVVDAGV